MKKILRFLLVPMVLSFPILQANASKETSADTTFQFNKKTIKVEDSIGQIKVKVFETQSENDTVPYKQIYEGVYTDGNSYERYTVMEEIGLQLPFITKRIKKHGNYSMKPHWAGFGFGYSNFSDRNLNMTTVNGVSLKPECSNEWTLNLSERILPIYLNNLGIVTGLGLDWRNFYLDNNTHFVDVNGVTGVYKAPDNIHYTYNRLRLMYITLPLMLQWQPSFYGNHNYYVSGGIIGEIKAFSSYKVSYVDIESNTITKTKDRGLNTTPLSMDYFIQAGCKSISAYAKYSPFSLFEAGKGPDVRAVSLGIIFHFE